MIVGHFQHEKGILFLAIISMEGIIARARFCASRKFVKVEGRAESSLFVPMYGVNRMIPNKKRWHPSYIDNKLEV